MSSLRTINREAGTKFRRWAEVAPAMKAGQEAIMREGKAVPTQAEWFSSHERVETARLETKLRELTGYLGAFDDMKPNGARYSSPDAWAQFMHSTENPYGREGFVDAVPPLVDCKQVRDPPYEEWKKRRALGETVNTTYTFSGREANALLVSLLDWYPKVDEFDRKTTEGNLKNPLNLAGRSDGEQFLSVAEHLDLGIKIVTSEYRWLTPDEQKILIEAVKGS